MGNHASVSHALSDIGLRVRVSSDKEILDECDLIVLPGVGAFPDAMEALHRLNLVEYLHLKARQRCPILGICLGMQLLASVSEEHGYTSGLDLIPGEIKRLKNGSWHIGWNSVHSVAMDNILSTCDGEAFYFNHAYSYHGPKEFQLARTYHDGEIVSVIRRGNVVGLQFHPEKSQHAGKNLLQNVIKVFCNA
jgi:glutamine amidotransferase